MYTKASIFNLTLGMLLLSRQISDTATDRSNENNVLNTHWNAAYWGALEDMDLDGCSTQVTLELLATNPADYLNYIYAYKYPTTCVFLRRIKSCATMDDRQTHIEKIVRMRDGVKTILTNKQFAVAEVIENDFPLSALTANAGLAVAAKLALLSTPLIVGKGAVKLKKDLEETYVLYKAQASEVDARENWNFVSEATTSEFVNARTE